MNDNIRPHYLAIGQVSRDLTPQGEMLGGTVSFACQTAHALGWRTSLLSSASPDFDVARQLPYTEMMIIPSAETTTFENRYTKEGEREQYLYHNAAPISLQKVPQAWRNADIIHLAPITPLLERDFTAMFAGRFVALTPQGWLRSWNADGRVVAVELAEGERVLPATTAVVLSEHDLPSADSLQRICRHAPLVVVTKGRKGCVIYRHGHAPHLVSAPIVEERNPTGAGDIFATAFFIMLYQTKGNVAQSADFATELASASVTRESFAEKVTLIREMVSDHPHRPHNH